MDFSWTTIIIVILLIVIVYFIWTMLSSSSSTVSTGGSNAKDSTQLTVTLSNSFTFSTWLAISDWNNSGGGTIVSNISKESPPSPPSMNDFSLTLGKNSNDLNLTIGADTAPITISNIVPLQPWASIIVSVNNGHSVDIYINGKLVRTTALEATYTLPAGSVNVGGNITGLISTTFNSASIGPQDAWNIYSSGYGSGTGSSVTDFFNKYKVRFAFVKDNVELSKLDI